MLAAHSQERFTQEDGISLSGFARLQCAIIPFDGRKLTHCEAVTFGQLSFCHPCTALDADGVTKTSFVTFNEA